MASQSYMTRALKARDPRFARILDKLGYERADLQAEKPKGEAPKNDEIDEVGELRAEYERVVGKRPFMGWKADDLRGKIAAAKADD